MAGRQVRVLIVDDSAAMRQVLTSILSSDPAIEVVGTAADPFFAREKIISLAPDVVTLDVEMPRMDGLTFLDKLMRGRPTPVVMISSMTQRGAEITLRALELGAVDFFPKPTLNVLNGVVDGAEKIIEKVKTAARARVKPSAQAASPVRSAASREQTSPVSYRLSHQILAIGASTGGTEAIRGVLTAMPPNAPGIVIVQHMSPGFIASFAERLNGLCAIGVTEAKDGDRILPGHALIAPGNFHASVVRSGTEYAVRVTTAPPVNRHRPSVDVLFDSCAEHAGRNAIGAILTGMGDDGARGLRRMRDAGSHAIAQDEETCVVFGLPKEAISHGGAEYVLPLPRIAEQLLKCADGTGPAARSGSVAGGRARG